MSDCMTELFGPVATVHEFESADEAVAMANKADGILQAYVFSSDVKEAADMGRRLNSGLVSTRLVPSSTVHAPLTHQVAALTALHHNQCRS